ncbi:SDR family NAD(P)-dependent oxidoreductase [Geodermatophilus sp. SYSU D00691]
MRRPFVFAGATAVVTGAASGIGEALAHALAARGSDLVLLDRDAERLDGVAGDVRVLSPGRAVTTRVVDLADDAATRAVGERLAAEHPGTTLLVNNAGVALGGRFDEVTLEEFDWVLDVNFRAVVRLTHALLPVLTANPGAHLVNVSSIFGILAPPGQAAYAASKFAVRGFSEALRAELAGDGVGVTVVHPGGIRTRIAESARVGSGVDPAEAARGREQFARLLRIPPEKAAAQIVDAVERRRPRLLIGASAKLPDVLVRLFPGSYGRPLARLARR